jgi:predicted DNA-binding transcriptional regulator YafY
MNKGERLFKLVLLLRRARTTTALQLPRELDVSERTIYRDIQSLILSGVPVEGEAGVGYVLRRDFDLPPLMFSNEEAQALLLGARMVQAWGDPALEEAARGVLDKVRAVAGKTLIDDLDSQTLMVPDFHIDPVVRLRLGQVREGILQQRRIEFHYTRADGEEATRSVRPLGLFFWGTTWSLAAWCELRNAFRNFRIDRMNDMELTHSAYSNEPGKTLDDYMRGIQTEEC